MKNKSLVCLLAMLMLPMAARAQQKQVNLVGTVGMAPGNIERLIVNMGIEMEVFHHFFAQVSLDNFLSTGSMRAYNQDDRLAFSQTLRTQVFGLNLLGTFKLPLTRQTAWLARAGLSFSFRTRSSYYDRYYDGYGYDDYYDYYDYYPGPYSAEGESPLRTGLAYALGTGIEQRLSEKLALTGGATYESLFDKNAAVRNNEQRGNWLKLAVGFNYRIR